jgi:2'-hydroxyisoflavone reductase
VQFWTELPLWIPAAKGPSVFTHHSADAEGAGLRWRPLAETVADTWAWQQSLRDGWRPAERTLGLAADRERDLLFGWHAQETARQAP